MGRHRKYKFKVTIHLKDGGILPMGADSKSAAERTKAKELKDPLVRSVDIKPWND